ncbi:MAG: GlsB/YeaQ/YmgE family stress response membrane protein [Pseudomonadota bacterium]
MQPAQIVVTIIAGIVAGWLASFVLGGGGLIKYLIWGLLGSAVGGFLLPLVGIKLDLGHPLLTQIVTAAIGAVVVVLIARLIA